MKQISIALVALFLVYSAPAAAQANPEQEVLTLSKTKWRWMSERNVDSLAALFESQAMFVHMGGSWGTDRELEIIRSGGIHYKHAEPRYDEAAPSRGEPRRRRPRAHGR